MLKPIILNVSELEAPEPMRLILNALTQLQSGQFLLVQHRQEPVPLYPKLTAMGFEYVVRDYGKAVHPQFHVGIGLSCNRPAIEQQMTSPLTSTLRPTL